MKLEAIKCDGCGRIGLSVDDTRVTGHKCAGAWTIVASAEVPCVACDTTIMRTKRVVVPAIERLLAACHTITHDAPNGQPNNEAERCLVKLTDGVEQIVIAVAGRPGLAELVDKFLLEPLENMVSAEADLIRDLKVAEDAVRKLLEPETL